jgi:predicted SPOUT superfamily RNA methylase MTH1
MALEADIGDMEIALILAMAALGSFVAAYIIHEHAVRKDQESAPRTESLWGYVVRSFRQLTHVEAMSLAATVLLLVSYVGNRYLDAISNVS